MTAANQIYSVCCSHVQNFLIHKIVTMEKGLNKVLEDLINTEGVTGCVVSDKQGLCLGSRGTASPDSSGLITAISEYAKKLHSNEPAPTIVLEDNEKQCIIQSNDKLVISVYKNVVT